MVARGRVRRQTAGPQPGGTRAVSGERHEQSQGRCYRSRRRSSPAAPSTIGRCTEHDDRPARARGGGPGAANRDGRRLSRRGGWFAPTLRSGNEGRAERGEVPQARQRADPYRRFDERRDHRHRHQRGAQGARGDGGRLCRLPGRSQFRGDAASPRAARRVRGLHQLRRAAARDGCVRGCSGRRGRRLEAGGRYPRDAGCGRRAPVARRPALHRRCGRRPDGCRAGGPGLRGRHEPGRALGATGDGARRHSLHGARQLEGRSRQVPGDSRSEVDDYEQHDVSTPGPHRHQAVDEPGAGRRWPDRHLRHDGAGDGRVVRSQPPTPGPRQGASR